MRVTLRSLVVVATTALVGSALVPAVPAAAHHKQHPHVFLVSDARQWEYRKLCDSVAPFDCRTESTMLTPIIELSRGTGETAPVPSEPFTVDFLIEEITAEHGVNYDGPTSGTLLIEPRFGAAATNLFIPVLDTGGSGEPDVTLRVRLTGTSLPNADFSDTGVSTIRSAGTVPRDCDPSRSDGLSMSITCTDRPAGDQWTVMIRCQFEGGGFPFWKEVFGPTVTGNGTSSASCTEPNFMRFSGWSFRSLNS